MLGTLAAQRLETPQHFFTAQARINEESGMACLEQRAVARASRRQNGSRNEIASLSRVLQQLTRARTAKMMANCRATSTSGMQLMN